MTQVTDPAGQGVDAAGHHRLRSLPTPPPRRTVQVRTGDGTRIHAEVFGPADAPAVVFSHGIMCGIGAWTYQINALSEQYRVVAYDQRGHGHSGRPRGSRWYTVRALGQDLQAVLAQCLPDGRPAVVVGHSMGGISIMSWAGEFPTEVRRRAVAAALVNTAADEVLRHSGGAHMLQAMRMLGRGAALAPLMPPITVGVRDVLRWLAFGDFAAPGDLHMLSSLVTSSPPRVRSHFARHLLAMDLRPQLSNLTIPTLVLAGANDRLLPPVHSEHIVAGLPNLIDYEVLPKVGHMGPFEAAERVTDRIAGLIEDYAS
jgi:pimeloyl-ACP methyl ester carboxylesterase